MFTRLGVPSWGYLDGIFFFPWRLCCHLPFLRSRLVLVTVVGDVIIYLLCVSIHEPGSWIWVRRRIEVRWTEKGQSRTCLGAYSSVRGQGDHVIMQAISAAATDSRA